MNETVKVFKALADEKRLKVLSLIKGEEKCACVLLEELDMTQSGLSYHMKILQDAGIVKGRPDGKWVHYRIAPQCKERIAKLLASVVE